MSNSFCHVHCEGIPWPSSHSQTSNEESMLSDAYAAVELKTTPKMKGVFREKCKVLQYFGKASVFILHLLITVVSFWICSSMKNEIIKLKTNIAFNFLISHFSYPDAFIKIRKQALSFESIHLTFSWPCEYTGLRRTLGHTQETEGRGRTQVEEVKMVKNHKWKMETISKGRLKLEHEITWWEG